MRADLEQAPEIKIFLPCLLKLYWDSGSLIGRSVRKG
jgi:hypothetical protein